MDNKARHRVHTASEVAGTRPHHQGQRLRDEPNGKRDPAAGEFEWFNLASKPITRECLSFGAGIVHEKGFRVDGDSCVSCGTCEDVCPQHVVHMGAEGTYVIDEAHCLHCGNCFEHCPAEAIGRLG